MYRAPDLTDPDRGQFSTPLSFALIDGRHTVTADYDECGNLLASVATPITVTLGDDSAPPSASIAIDQDYTKDEWISIHTPADDGDSELGEVAFSNDNLVWTEYDYQAHNAWQLPLEDYGLRTVYAKVSDSFGNWSPVVFDTVVYDPIAPTAAAPTQAFVEGTSIIDGKVPVRVSLSGSDDQSGVSSYSLNQKTDSGVWKNVPVAASAASAVSSTSVNRLLAPQHKYTFRARATDYAANSSAWATGMALNVKRFQESSTRIRYAGTWSQVSNASLWGGAARKSTKAGASATFSFTGRAFALVGRRGPGRGQARIYVNGSLVDTIDLYAASLTNRRVVWAESWTNAVSRTVKVVVAGTAGRPLVELDALVTGE